jgi:beta-glucosidase
MQKSTVGKRSSPYVVRKAHKLYALLAATICTTITTASIICPPATAENVAAPQASDSKGGTSGSADNRREQSVTTAGDAAAEAKVQELLKALTFDEKIQLLAGTDDEMHIPGIARLHIPSLKFSDGPVGVRCWGLSTAYPCGAMLASTWDLKLAYEMGKNLGKDSRARGVHILLGPGVDLYRVPQCGRNFEYFGEDPFLASKLAVAWIKGVQDQGVATSVKHYAANDQETLRDSVDTIVSERRLHEICFPPFKAAVQEGHVWTVMAAYNKINGDWCTANKYLLTDVLRGQWGFKGVLMSDWGAVHELKKPIIAGNDLEMGKRKFYTVENIKQLIDSGEIKQKQVDEHVERILRTVVSMGFMDRPQEERSIAQKNAMSDATALQIAAEGLVLLKNDQAFLPLSMKKTNKIVVLGPNASPAVTGGGGSSFTQSFVNLSLRDAIFLSAGPRCQTDYIAPALTLPVVDETYHTRPTFEPLPASEQSLRGEYFDNADLHGEPVLSKEDRDIDFKWGEGYPAGEIKSKSYSIRWKGTIRAPQTGNYAFACTSDGARVLLDGTVVVESNADRNVLPHGVFKTVEMKRGQTHELVIEYRHHHGAATMQLTWGRANEDFNEKERQTIEDADCVIVGVGFNSYLECEGFDRPYDLPAGQVALINKVSKLNPKVVAVINSGGNVGMASWIDHTKAVMQAWYPGQCGNLAVGQALFGTLNPSGKLPDTFEMRWEDSPAYGNYPGNKENGGRVIYEEGIYSGYRWFDKKNIAPRFPFGYGLSFTTFSIDDMQISNDTKAPVASVTVKNTGSIDGAEVVQLYVRPIVDARTKEEKQPAHGRPVQELKGFARVPLKAGESKRIEFHLDGSSFATYDEHAHAWVSPPGEYEIAIGSSSRDIAVRKRISF